MPSVVRVSMLCLLPLARAFRTATSEQGALQAEQEAEQEADLDGELEEALEYELGEFEEISYEFGEFGGTESDAEEEYELSEFEGGDSYAEEELEVGACKPGHQPLNVGGHSKTYGLPKATKGYELPQKCMPPYVGNIIFYCKGRQWILKDMSCRKDPNAKAASKAPSPSRYSPSPGGPISPRDSKKDKCYALCKPPQKTPKCGRCTHKQQCVKGAFCCPYLKLCLVKGGTKDRCGDYARLAANCQGCGKTASNPEDTGCKCANKDWPKRWLGKCTNSPDQWQAMCDRVIDSKTMLAR